MIDRIQFPGQGLEGGRPGALGEMLIDGGPRPAKSLTWLEPEASVELNLPGGGGYGLRITSATWGLGSRQQDVTNRLQNMVRNNRLSVGVSPKTMGGDPVVGATKKLTVYYNWNGRSLSKVAPENTMLNLP